MEYTELLNKADETDDPNLRMVYVGESWYKLYQLHIDANTLRHPNPLPRAVAWAISVYTAHTRTWKPFNPILGETYEFTNFNNVWFVNEQVRTLPLNILPAIMGR